MSACPQSHTACFLHPCGFDPKVFLANPSSCDRPLGEVEGEAANDPYYTDPALTGADELQRARFYIGYRNDVRAQFIVIPPTIYRAQLQNPEQQEPDLRRAGRRGLSVREALQ